VYAGTAINRETSETEHIFFQNAAPVKREYVLYLPLYNGVNIHAIGLNPEARIEKTQDFAIPKPVVYYGTSITQGGCASRAGMSYQAILSRQLNLDFVNQGFSGNGLGEKEVAELVAEIDASCFVLDFMANHKDRESLEEVYEPFVRYIRAKHPATPIVLLTRIYTTREDSIHGGRELTEAKRDVIRQVAAKLIQEGDQNIHLVEGHDLLGPTEGDGLVDGFHPNDLGFQLMAERLETILFNLLLKPLRIHFDDPESVRQQKPILIAHRGGVVTAESPECSLAAIQSARKHGYAMVELDVQKSRDGVPIVFHDRDLKEACGIDDRIENMDSDQILRIKFRNTEQKICTLERVLEECRKLSLGVMLDVKVSDDEPFFQTIADLIRKYDYQQSTITINSDPKLRQCFQDVVMLTVTNDEFNRLQQGESIDLKGKYWFGLPQRISNEMVKRMQKHGAYVIPAINTFRYPEDNHFELARQDIERLTEAGVEGFQIDSIYHSLFK
ncbi:MAG: SGNH/GDSL hydrolase family protein, partial [bacterium]